MYCSNCNCLSCQSQRLSSFNSSKAMPDVLRLVLKAGERGLTKNELTNQSRPFRSVEPEQQALMLDQLEAAGLLVKHRFRAPTRGKPRDVYLAIQVSQ